MAISDFLAQLSGGGARPNQFRITLPFPAFTTESNETEQMRFLARSTAIPGATIGVVEVPFRGRQIPIAGDKTFEEWNITVVNDTDFDLRNAFERWSNSIQEHSNPVGIVAPAEYMVDADVEQLGRDDSVLKTYTMIGAWPINVGQIELSMDSNDEIETFEVGLRFVHWQSNTTS